jgi:hypothetical protein
MPGIEKCELSQESKGKIMHLALLPGPELTMSTLRLISTKWYGHTSTATPAMPNHCGSPGFWRRASDLSNEPLTLGSWCWPLDKGVFRRLSRYSDKPCPKILGVTLDQASFEQGRGCQLDLIALITLRCHPDRVFYPQLSPCTRIS